MGRKWSGGPCMFRLKEAILSPSTFTRCFDVQKGAYTQRAGQLCKGFYQGHQQHADKQTSAFTSLSTVHLLSSFSSHSRLRPPRRHDHHHHHNVTQIFCSLVSPLHPHLYAEKSTVSRYDNHVFPLLSLSCVAEGIEKWTRTIYNNTNTHNSMYPVKSSDLRSASHTRTSFKRNRACEFSPCPLAFVYVGLDITG